MKQDPRYREQEPIAEEPGHPVIYYRAQGKSPRGGNQYPVPSSMATQPSREDQEEEMFDEMLVPYHALGLTDPRDIRDLALLMGTPALAEAELALEAEARSTALLLLPSDPPGRLVAGFVRGLARRFGRLAISLYPASLPYTGTIEMLRASLPDVEGRLQMVPIERPSLAAALTAIGARPGHALEVYAPGPIMDALVSERDGGGLPIDPTVIRIVAAQVPHDDPARIRNAMAQPTDAPAKALLDPHVFSDPDGLDRMRRALGEGVVMEFLADISPRHDREEGATRILQIVEANRGLLSQRGVSVEGMRFLGKGNNGLAWELRDKRVLKVTTDDAEAAVAVHLKGKSLKHVFRVHDVWAFPGKYEGHHVYGLITEAGLVKPSQPERSAFARMISVLAGDPELDYAELDDRKRDQLEAGDLRPLLQALMAERRLPPEIKREALGLVKRFDLPGICADAKRLGVAFDVHPGNIMRRPDGTFVIIDIGTGGDQEAAKPPFIEQRLQEVGIAASPVNDTPRGGPLGRGGNQSSSWSSGRLALRQPADHVPEDENEHGQIALDTEYGVKLPMPAEYEAEFGRKS